MKQNTPKLTHHQQINHNISWIEWNWKYNISEFVKAGLSGKFVTLNANTRKEDPN